MWAQDRMDFLTANCSTGYLIQSLFNNKIWHVSTKASLYHIHFSMQLEFILHI